MSEELTPKKSRKIKNGARKVASSTKRFAKKPIAKKLLLILIVAFCVYGIFYLGQQSGAKNQKAEDVKKIAASNNNNTSRTAASTSRKTFIGTIASVSDKSMELTPRTGDKVKVTIDDTTRITGGDAKKSDVKALKKDQKVIVSTTKSKDGVYTATRIRIQK